jgi:hypothetical protein
VDAILGTEPSAAFAVMERMRHRKFKAAGYSMIAIMNRMKKKFT